MINFVKQEEVPLFLPNYFNEELLHQKDLFDSCFLLTKRYLYLQSMYKYFLEDYLDELLDIRSYDNKILESSLHFKEVQPSSKDIYQRSSKFHFYYVRNTLYIEKLGMDDLNLLVFKYNQKDFSLDDKVREMIGRTFKDVMFQDVGSGVVRVSYGFQSSYSLAPNNALILGLRFDEEIPSSMSIDEFFKSQSEQALFLNSLLKEQYERYSKVLDIPIKIIRYNDSSVNIEKKTEFERMIR